jgi:flavorubredoxin
VETALAKLADLPVSLLAPSHGVVWRRPVYIQQAVELYRRWAAAGTGTRGEPGITLLYGSMYGNTERMADRVAQGISGEKVPLAMFDVAKADASYILPPLFLQQGVIVSTPTYEGFMFPSMNALLELAATKRFRNKTAAFFGSYGWNGGALKCVERLAERLKWEMVDTFEFCGSPSPQDLETGVEFGARFARRIQELAG